MPEIKIQYSSTNKPAKGYDLIQHCSSPPCRYVLSYLSVLAHHKLGRGELTSEYSVTWVRVRVKVRVGVRVPVRVRVRVRVRVGVRVGVRVRVPVRVGVRVRPLVRKQATP